MTTVTLSPKFQVVIPKEIREELKLSHGMKLTAIAYEGRVELIPLQPIEKLEGTLKGMDTSNIREKSDRKI